jgi:Arc/MetJ family transcription regulator
MKTTIEIADDLLVRAQRRARKEKTTLRALTEAGLRHVLGEKDAKQAKWKWKPVTFAGSGMTDEFKNAGWEKIRDEIYRGRGA